MCDEDNIIIGNCCFTGIPNGEALMTRHHGWHCRVGHGLPKILIAFAFGPLKNWPACPQKLAEKQRYVRGAIKKFCNSVW